MMRGLATNPMKNRRIRIAAMADLHCTMASAGKLAPIFNQATEVADVILLCGDLTDCGLPQEARVLVDELAMPLRSGKVIGVLGNHDYESGNAMIVSDTLSEAGITIFDGTFCEFFGIGFTGVKGFVGGFASHTLEAWGKRQSRFWSERPRTRPANWKTGWPA
jgi:Icc-related predicted phosphoesterase